MAGFAAFERSLLGPRKVFAVYRLQDSLFFSAGKERWELDWDGPTFEHGSVAPLISRFRVIQDGEPARAFSYQHVGRHLLHLIDPTYDAIDREGDFFLRFVAEHGCDPEWRMDVLDRWVPANRGSL